MPPGPASGVFGAGKPAVSLWLWAVPCGAASWVGTEPACLPAAGVPAGVLTLGPRRPGLPGTEPRRRRARVSAFLLKRLMVLWFEVWVSSREQSPRSRAS